MFLDYEQLEEDSPSFLHYLDTTIIFVLEFFLFPLSLLLLVLAVVSLGAIASGFFSSLFFSCLESSFNRSKLCLISLSSLDSLEKIALVYI